VEERRAARIGTLSGLALLAGGTALVAATGGAHSVFAAALLWLLALGMAHALLDEINRQARRRSAGGWARPDTVNAVLLGCWSAAALTVAALVPAPTSVRVVGLVLSAGYALSCGYFVVARRRTVSGSGGTAGGSVPTPGPSESSAPDTDVMPDGYGMTSR
jgi:hypothetical protein